MQHADSRLAELIRPAVEFMGFELVGVERLSAGRKAALLRVYIDRPDGGLTVDDCAVVSRQLSDLLDVEDPIPGHYELEVSSPGIERPLFDRAQLARFQGQRARVRLTIPLAGRRNFVGVLAGIEGDRLCLEEDQARHELPLDQIERAHLAPHC